MHIYFDKSTEYGSQLRRMLQDAERSDDEMRKIRDTMIQMRTGDGSSADHYQTVATRFGFGGIADAKAAFEELDSAYAKTSGNGAVSNVRAARDQLYAKLR